MGILDSISKNPSFLALAVVGIGLFIFRDKISQFFSDITGGAEGAAQIAETGGILARNLQSNLTLTPLPEDPLFGESGLFTNISKAFSSAFESISSFEFPSIPNVFAEQPTQPQQPAPEPTDFTDVGMAAARARQTEELTPAQIFAVEERGVTIAPSLLDSIIAPFTGAGISFEGGTIFETPIENLSLNQIIEKFMVTASQAADIKAQAIGFTPEEETFLSQGQEISPLGDIASQPAVSDPQFEGLTPEQIFLQIVGGNISNF